MIVVDILICFSLLLLLIYLIMSLYWAIVFIFRICNFRKYQRGVARNLSASNHSSNEFDHRYYHHQTEIRKYIYLLFINLAEVYGAISCVFHTVFNDKFTKFARLRRYHFNWTNCSSGNIDNFHLNEFHIEYASNYVLNMVYISGITTELFVGTLMVCLMGYLTGRMKRVGNSSNRFTPWIPLLVTFLVNILMFGLACKFSLLFVNRIVLLITIPIYFCFFLRAVKQFGRALLQNAGERLTQHGCRKGYQRYEYFRYTIKIISFGFMVISVGLFLSSLSEFLISLIFFHKSYFPFNLILYNNPLCMTQHQTTVLVQLFYFTWIFGDVIVTIGVLLLISPFVYVTTCVWINFAYKHISGKSKKKYSFKPEDLDEPLLGNV